jgi:hypothetical protein
MKSIDIIIFTAAVQPFTFLSRGFELLDRPFNISQQVVISNPNISICLIALLLLLINGMDSDPITLIVLEHDIRGPSPLVQSKKKTYIAFKGIQKPNIILG